MPEKLTGHARQRRDQRNLTDKQIRYVLRYGTVEQRTGVTAFILLRRDIPAGDLRWNKYSKLEGVVVLLSPEGKVVTAYHSKGRPWRDFKKKQKYRMNPRQRGARL